MKICKTVVQIRDVNKLITSRLSHDFKKYDIILDIMINEKALCFIAMDLYPIFLSDGYECIIRYCDEKYIVRMEYL